MPRLTSRRTALALTPLFFLVVVPALAVGCPQQEQKKETASKSGDDDESTKKKDKKKKSGDDDSTGDDDDSTASPHASSDAGLAAAPVPAACAPDAAGKLGAKPKLLASGGEPGVSIGVWGKNGEAPLSNIGITLHADGRCYVDYIESHGDDPSAQWAGFDLPKGSVGASSGVSERGKNSFVGFRVSINEVMRKGGEAHTDTFTRFYGYVHAEGEPYSCGAIAGEKTCAMYQKALLVKSESACTAAKGGGPIDPLAQIKMNGPAGKIPPIGSIQIQLPSIAGADAAVPDVGLSVDAGTCNGATCVTNAFLSKESEHVYVRVSAGKPNACDTVMGGPHVGDVWYFDDNAWKKR